MWNLIPTVEYQKRLEKWPKKYRRELGAMIANLTTVLSALRKGAKTEQIQFGFLHHEPGGVWAIDQKGGGAGLKQTRLYVYAHNPAKTLHAIIMGDKSTQKEDIAYSKAYADGLKGSEEPTSEDGVGSNKGQ